MAKKLGVVKHAGDVTYALGSYTGAASTLQADATIITTAHADITAGAVNTSVKLEASMPIGTFRYVMNSTGTEKGLYPAVGESINGVVNALWSIPLSRRVAVILIKRTSTDWEGHVTFGKLTSSADLVSIDSRLLVGGILSGRRIISTGSSSLSPGAWAISAGWGVGATVSASVGRDQHGYVEITSGTGPTEDPTATLTYVDGSWGAGPQTIKAEMVLPTSALMIPVQESNTATTMVLTFNGTPLPSTVYRIKWLMFGA